MIRVISSSAAPSHLERLREWIAEEWGGEDSLEEQSETITVPPALVAIDRYDLLGGLTFSNFPKPDGEALGLWINALFVAAEYRRKGIASHLIRAAEIEAARTGERALFALTAFPRLYENLGWQRVRSDGEGSIVRASLEE